jgi:hypothetical protein
MSLQRFIKHVNAQKCREIDSVAPTVAELHEVAAVLAQATQARGLAAAPSYDEGPSLLEFVAMMDAAHLELQKLGIAVNL